MNSMITVLNLENHLKMQGYDFIRVNDRIKDGKELRISINISLKEIDNCLTILKNEVAKNNADFSILMDACSHLLSCVPLPMHIYDNSFVLRSRPNFNGEVFNKASDISYNPFPGLIKLNRFNLEHEPVFYGAVPISSDKADGVLTTICESYKELFDNSSTVNIQYVTIGKWNVIKPIKMAMLTFYETAWAKSEHVKNINPIYAEFIGLSCNDEDNKKCLMVYEYFSQCAGKRFDTRNSYLITTAFYHAVQERYGSETGIIYSSSSTDNYGLNIVLSKEIIDGGYLELNHVVMYKCERNPSNPMNFKILPCCNGVDVNANGEFQLLGIL